MFQIWRDACWPLYHCHCKICERAKAAEGVVKIALEDVAQPVTAAAEIRLPSPEVNEAEADDEDPDYDSWTTKSTWGSIWDRYNLIPSRPGNAQMLSEQYDACCRLSKPVLLPKINSDFALPIPHLGCGSHCSWNTLRHGCTGDAFNDIGSVNGDSDPCSSLTATTTLVGGFKRRSERLRQTVEIAVIVLVVIIRPLDRYIENTDISPQNLDYRPHSSVYHELALAGIEASKAHLSLPHRVAIALLFNIDYMEPLAYTKDVVRVVKTTIVMNTDGSSIMPNRNPNTNAKFEVGDCLYVPRPRAIAAMFNQGLFSGLVH
ncbi:hypothetical protein IW262DRAFT_1302676 [Armillaria fumosa]|nr:hypothetical protein IW262DRAFT_1302676 [Armillaria fumosa]